MSGMSDLAEWAAIEAAAWTRAHEDHDAHVRAHERFDIALTVQICLLLSEHAVAKCKEAERRLDLARDERRIVVGKLLDLDIKNASMVDVRAMREVFEAVEDAVIANTRSALDALAYVRRTTATLEQIVRLQAMGRR